MVFHSILQLIPKGNGAQVGQKRRHLDAHGLRTLARACVQGSTPTLLAHTILAHAANSNRALTLSRSSLALVQCSASVRFRWSYRVSLLVGLNEWEGSWRAERAC